MTWHVWGDDWFDKYGDLLHDAEAFIMKWVSSHSNYYLSSKEKYGTIRYEGLYPKDIDQQLTDADYNQARRVLANAVEKAAKQWPEIKEEIMDDYDPEYL